MPDKIRPPQSNPKRELLRAGLETGAELFGGAPFVKLYRITHPTQSEIDHSRWREDVSDKLNESSQKLDLHDQQLYPTETLTETASELAVGLARACPNGLGREFYDRDMLRALLSDQTKSAADVDDAVFQMEELGLLTRRRVIGGPGWVSLTPLFYEQVDPQVMGWEPPVDALELARHLLETMNGRAANIQAAVGWELRRFNPAWRVLLRVFPEGRISREIQPKFASSAIALIPEDASRLRRFLSG